MNFKKILATLFLLLFLISSIYSFGNVKDDKKNQRYIIVFEDDSPSTFSTRSIESKPPIEKVLDMMESKEEVISEKTSKETMPSILSSSKTVKTPQNNDFSNNSPKEIDYIEYSNLFEGISLEINDSDIVEELASQDFVKEIYLDEEFDILVSNTTRNLLNISQIWNGINSTYTGKGVSVAVLDTGLDINHPDFNYCSSFDGEEITYLGTRVDLLVESQHPYLPNSKNNIEYVNGTTVPVSFESVHPYPKNSQEEVSFFDSALETSFNFSTNHPYENDENVSFEINLSHLHAENIIVELKNFSLETNFDFLYLYDKNNVLVETYDGNLGDFNSTLINGDYVKGVFTSDYSITEHGFDIERVFYNVSNYTSLIPQKDFYLNVSEYNFDSYKLNFRNLSIERYDFLVIWNEQNTLLDFYQTSDSGTNILSSLFDEDFLHFEFYSDEEFEDYGFYIDFIEGNYSIINASYTEVINLSTYGAQNFTLVFDQVDVEQGDDFIEFYLENGSLLETITGVNNGLEIFVPGDYVRIELDSDSFTENFGYNTSHVLINVSKSVDIDENCTQVADFYDFYNNDEDPFDDQGHGTHVASTIASNNSNPNLLGIAPDVELGIYKVCGTFNCRTSSILAAMDRAVDPNGDGNYSDRFDIISMSLGNGASDPNYLTSLAVDNLSSFGIIPVIAGGNSGSEYGTIGSPGTSRSAITVGATFKDSEAYGFDFGNPDDVVYFSSRGPTSIGTIKPDVVAPGVNICAARTSWGSYSSSQSCVDSNHVEISGTSMATPIVSGSVALIKEAHPSWSLKEIKASLKATAKDVGDDYFTQGWGRIQPLEVINLERPACVVEFDTQNYDEDISNLSSLSLDALINCGNFSHYELVYIPINTYSDMSNYYNESNQVVLYNGSSQGSISTTISTSNILRGFLKLIAHDYNETYSNYDLLYFQNIGSDFFLDNIYYISDSRNGRNVVDPYVSIRYEIDNFGSYTSSFEVIESVYYQPEKYYNLETFGVDSLNGTRLYSRTRPAYLGTNYIPNLDFSLPGEYCVEIEIISSEDSNNQNNREIECSTFYPLSPLFSVEYDIDKIPFNTTSNLTEIEFEIENRGVVDADANIEIAYLEEIVFFGEDENFNYNNLEIFNQSFNGSHISMNFSYKNISYELENIDFGYSKNRFENYDYMYYIFNDSLYLELLYVDRNDFYFGIFYELDYKTNFTINLDAGDDITEENFNITVPVFTNENISDAFIRVVDENQTNYGYGDNFDSSSIVMYPLRGVLNSYFSYTKSINQSFSNTLRNNINEYIENFSLNLNFDNDGFDNLSTEILVSINYLNTSYPFYYSDIINASSPEIMTFDNYSIELNSSSFILNTSNSSIIKSLENGNYRGIIEDIYVEIEKSIHPDVYTIDVYQLNSSLISIPITNLDVDSYIQETLNLSLQNGLYELVILENGSSSFEGFDYENKNISLLGHTFICNSNSSLRDRNRNNVNDLCERDLDYDLVDDSVERENAGNIIGSNTILSRSGLSLYSNNSLITNSSISFNTSRRIQLFDVFDNISRIEFDYNFTNLSLDLSQVDIIFNESSDSRSYVIVSNLSLNSSTKSITLDRRLNSQRVCVKDEEISSFTQITSSCTGSNEHLLNCDGNVDSNGYSCSISGSRLTVSGLRNSGVVEFENEAPPSSGSSSSGGGGGSGSSSGGSSSSSSGGGGFYIPQDNSDENTFEDNNSFTDVEDFSNIELTDVSLEESDDTLSNVTDDNHDNNSSRLNENNLTQNNSKSNLWLYFVFGLTLLLLVFFLFFALRKKKEPSIKETSSLAAASHHILSQREEQLLAYIKSQEDRGISDEQIMKQCIEVGWPKEIVEDLFKRLK